MVSCRGQRERRTLTLLLSTPSAHAPSLPECSRAMSPTQAERTRKLGFCLPGTCRSICLEGPEQMLPRSEGTAAASPLTAHPPPACSSCCRSRAQDACALPSHRHQPGTARQGFNSIPSSSLGILLTQREGSLSCSNALVILPVPIPPSLAAAHPPTSKLAHIRMLTPRSVLTSRHAQLCKRRTKLWAQGAPCDLPADWMCKPALRIYLTLTHNFSLRHAGGQHQ